MAETNERTPPRPRNAVPFRRGEWLKLPPAVGSPPPGDLAAVRSWLRDDDRPTAIDLFSGAGGLGLGLQDAGFRVIVGAEIDAASAETHLGNLGGLVYHGDLSNPADFIEHLQGWGIETCDLLCGGPPCQPFSRAGRHRIRALVDSGARASEDSRADLWQSFVAVARYLRPRRVLVENVPDLAMWDDGAVLVGICESLREIGLEVDARILDAFEHGVPQHRARLFIVGAPHRDEIAWPSPAIAPVTLRDAISDLPVVPGGQFAECLPYGGPRSELQRRLRRDVPASDRRKIHDHITRAVRPDDAMAFRLLPEGGTYDDLPPWLQRYRTDIFTDRYKRLSWDEVSRSITAHLAKDGYWYIHPQEHRTLSIREAARIQTFPDWFRFAGQPSLRFRQIGNAVPPLLAEAIGKRLIESLSAVPSISRRPRDRDDGVWFRRDLLRWHASSTRAVPWRESGAEPWHVMVAEVALRRARLSEMRRLYHHLIAATSSPTDLASDPTAALDRLVRIGIRSPAADAIVRIACALDERFDGKVPSAGDELLTLPGVGAYIAQAVQLFGFGHPAVLVDRNTRRVMSRLNGHGDERLWQARLDLHRLAGLEGPDAAFNAALLDLGWTVCRSSDPLCGRCPFRERCAVGAGTSPESDIAQLEEVLAS